MSQTSELLSDDDTASGVTYSDKYPYTTSSGGSDREERGKLERQHTEISELSDDSYLTYQPLLPNDSEGGGALGGENPAADNEEIQCSCDSCREEAMRATYGNQDVIVEEGECLCENCVKSREYIQYERTIKALDHSHPENVSSARTAQWRAGQAHWTGISFSDDDIEIMADTDYYHDKNVFYIDPSVARSLLSEFLVRDTPRRSDLHIHMDTRTKRQKFVARAVMIVSMTMFTVSALLVMVSLIMSDKIDDLVRGNNNLLHKPVLSSTPISIVTNLTDVITNVTRGQG